MEIPSINGGKFEHDWVGDYFLSVKQTESVNNPDTFDKRLYEELVWPASNLLLKFSDIQRTNIDPSGTTHVATPPIGYKLPSNSPENAEIGDIWLEGEYSPLEDTHGFSIPGVDNMGVWVKTSDHSHEATWILSIKKGLLFRNTLTGKAETRSHADLNLFKSIVQDIDQVIFAEEYRKAKQERDEERRHRFY